MKKLLRLLCALLSLVFVLSFVSCGDLFGSEEKETTEDEEENKDKKKTEDITFEFESNGDGTCEIVYIDFNGNEDKITSIEFPTKSPDGDKVVGIGNMMLTPYGNVPRMIEKADFENVLATMKENVAGNKENEFLYNKLRAYYILRDPNSVSDQVKEIMLKDCPITEITPVYVLDLSTAFDEMVSLSEILYELGGFTQDNVNASYDKLVKLAGKSLKDTVMKPYNQRYVSIQEVTVPDGVKALNGVLFGNWKSLTEVYLPDSIANIGSGVFAGCESAVTTSNGGEYVGNKENPYLVLLGATKDTTGSLNVADGTKFVADNALGDVYVNSDGGGEKIIQIVSVSIPASVISISKDAFINSNHLESISVSPDNQYYYASDNGKVLYDKNGNIVYSILYSYGEVPTPMPDYPENGDTEQNDSSDVGDSSDTNVADTVPSKN